MAILMLIFSIYLNQKPFYLIFFSYFNFILHENGHNDVGGNMTKCTKLFFLLMFLSVCLSVVILGPTCGDREPSHLLLRLFFLLKPEALTKEFMSSIISQRLIVEQFLKELKGTNKEGHSNTQQMCFFR